MKTSVLLLLGLCVGFAGAAIYFNRQKTPPPPAPVVEIAAPPASAGSEIAVIPKTAPPEAATIPEPIPVPAANPVASDPGAEAAAAFRNAVDALLSPQLTLQQKHKLFARFSNAGQTDEVIAELKRRAAANPTDPAIPTTLGAAQLEKLRVLYEAGADVNEVGILAMQADQSFNAALKIDPANWEAQFVKYSTMVYWPADAARDNEAAQKLSSLIDQQEALPQQPHFAQTYVVLGNQYQKIGKPDFAAATWRLGLTKFPADPALREKLAAQ